MQSNRPIECNCSFGPNKRLACPTKLPRFGTNVQNASDIRSLEGEEGKNSWRVRQSYANKCVTWAAEIAYTYALTTKKREKWAQTEPDIEGIKVELFLLEGGISMNKDKNTKSPHNCTHPVQSARKVIAHPPFQRNFFFTHLQIRTGWRSSFLVHTSVREKKGFSSYLWFRE